MLDYLRGNGNVLHVNLLLDTQMFIQYIFKDEHYDTYYICNIFVDVTRINPLLLQYFRWKQVKEGSDNLDPILGSRQSDIRIMLDHNSPYH